VQALYARHGFVTYEEFKVSKKCPPVFLMKRAPAPAAAAAAANNKASPLSPVFSIKSVVVGSSSAGGCGEASLAAAVAAKEAAAGSNGSIVGSSGSISAPSSPFIAVGREGLVELLPACTPADAQVIIRSASSASLLKEPSPAAAAAGGSNGSSKQGESPVEYGVSQDEAGHDSSSPAGAGGPSAAAAGGC
jgi:hypothetical protein